MSMFNMGGAATAKVVPGNFLKAGIHNVYFRGVTKADGYNAIEFKFEAVDGSGIHNERIFAPTSAERTESQYGTNPSQVEQFMCKIKAIIDAINPEAGKKIEEGAKFEAPDFDSFILLVSKTLSPKIGCTTNIKLVPTKGNYVGFPGFIAALNKEGTLYIKNRIIGEGLELSPKEKTAIEAAANAKPTNMATSANELDDLKADFETPETKEDDGLPF